MKYLFMGCVVFASWGNLYAQLIFTSLEDVWNYADKNNIQIISAEMGFQTAQIDQTQAWNNLMPTISANASFNDNIKIPPTLVPAQLFNPDAPAGTYTEAVFGRRYQYAFNVNAQLNLVNPQDWFTIKASQFQSEIASLNIEKNKQNIHEELASAYYGYLFYEKAVILAKQNTEIAQKILVISSNLFENGQVNLSVKNTAQIQYEKSEKNWVLMNQYREQSVMQLKKILNISLQDSIAIQEELNDHLPSLNNTGLTPNIDLQVYQRKYELSKTNLKASRYRYWPTLSFVFQHNTQIAGDEFFAFENSNTLPQQYYGLRLSMPILSGGSRNAQVKKSTLEMTQADLVYQQAIKNAEMEDQQLWDDYLSAKTLFEKSIHIKDLYADNDFHAAQQLEEEAISLQNRIRVFEEYVANQQEYLQALSNYLIQQYRLLIRQTDYSK